MKYFFNYLISFVFLSNIGFYPGHVAGQEEMTSSQYLQQLLKALPEDRYKPGSGQYYQTPGTPLPHVSPDDFTWGDWIHRTGELPPDFDELPSLPFLPDPLILDQGGSNIPVKTLEQWEEKRKEMKELAQHWITGTVPPPPGNVIAEVLEEKMWGAVTERTVLLRFGPGHKAQLHVNLLIPPGKGIFPVFICPWKKDRYDWVQAAVRRGYVGCRFAATDPKYGYPDDSQDYEKIWWPDYDFSALMRWGWAASRAIDYLYTLEYISKDKIGLTGLSRNGKMALMASAYDERITAVIPISGGTGGEIPFRYTSDKYNIETMERKTRTDPHWLHPRIRFFVGRESKLPVDQNSLMALIAPRGIMVTSSIIESAGNPWGIEQAYLSAKKVYEFLGEEDKIAINLRNGLHAPSARDMENYLDFFDYIFGRGDIKPENNLLYDYSFSRWLGISGEMINPEDFPVVSQDDLLRKSDGNIIKDLSAWKEKIKDIKDHVNWGLGEEPPSIGPGIQPDYMREVVGYPQMDETLTIKSLPLLFGQLYYPVDEKGNPEENNLPVVIYMHEYSYSSGYAKGGSEVYTRTGDIIEQYTDDGYAIYLFDQIGFGTRIEEGRHFYNRFPHWSKLGRMAADVRWSVDALSEIEFLDPQRIYAAGYALGGTVGLYSAALEDRIAGVISICGFTPMRSDIQGKTAEGIYQYSHLHGLIPRLGFFVGEESRIPWDFDEILACIAPRPLLVIAPTWDQYASSTDIQQCISKVKNVYNLYGEKNNISLYSPEDYNHFSDNMRKQVSVWMKENFKLK